MANGKRSEAYRQEILLALTWGMKQAGDLTDAHEIKLSPSEMPISRQNDLYSCGPCSLDAVWRLISGSEMEMEMEMKWTERTKHAYRARLFTRVFRKYVSRSSRPDH